MNTSKKIKKALSLDIKELLIRNGLQQLMIAAGAILTAIGFVIFQLEFPGSPSLSMISRDSR